MARHLRVLSVIETVRVSMKPPKEMRAWVICEAKEVELKMVCFSMNVDLSLSVSLLNCGFL